MPSPSCAVAPNCVCSAACELSHFCKLSKITPAEKKKVLRKARNKNLSDPLRDCSGRRGRG